MVQNFVNITDFFNDFMGKICPDIPNIHTTRKNKTMMSH